MAVRSRPFWANRCPRKQISDALALTQILLRGDVIYGSRASLSARLACVPFYFNACGERRLLAVGSRAGINWIQLGVELALDLASGGDGEYTFENDRFWPTRGRAFQMLDWRVPLGNMNHEFFRKKGPLLQDRFIWQTRAPYSRVRCGALKDMQIVLVTRSIYASLESNFFKLALSPKTPQIRIDDEDTFGWAAFLDREIEFFNSWGDAIKFHPAICHFRYEDLVADPVAGHREMLRFWGIDIADDIIAESLSRSSKAEMMKRIPPTERKGNFRVSTRGQEQRNVISADRRAWMAARLERKLMYDLGHDRAFPGAV